MTDYSTTTPSSQPSSSSSAFSVEDFQAQLAFPLDDFQREAADSITQGHSVVVCAPTGSGKTIVAEFAALRALSEGKKVFYTTPLKALSNQKFYDLRNSLGDANVGLLTGDISINRDARIVVMTTEIFRNLLYGGRGDNGLLDNLGYVVLDECHYMNDAERGTVWEESIIYCPEDVQIVALSATVANADELTAWINEVHHDTRLIYSDFRPVPLRFSFYDREFLLPLFEAPGKLNRKLKNDRKDGRFDRKSRIFRPSELINVMNEKQMLPAIFFTFSRKDCDGHLENTQHLKLLSTEERQTINRKVDEFLAQNEFLATNKQIPLIRNGFASHHAGLLPGIKHLVETLFQQGLIKVVFATETLAAGINMPARSTVITKISKRTDDGHRMLTASEFLQMSGRAGRRGMDPVGYVVVVSSPYEGALEAATLASSPADPLNSRFTPNYGMVLNLLRRHSLEKAEFLVRQSFAQFTAARRLRPLEEAKAEHEREIKELTDFTCPFDVSDKDFHSFNRSKAMMSETGRFIRILQKQLSRHGNDPDLQSQLQHEQGKMDNLRAFTASLPCEKCDLLRKHQKAEDRLDHQIRKLRDVQRKLTQEQDTFWQRFMNIHSLLKDTGYLDDQDRPSSKGLITVQLRAENEYAMTEVVTSGLLEGLSPSHLAGLMCALINDSTRENQFVRLPLSAEVSEIGQDIEKMYRRLDKFQRKHGVAVGLSLNSIASPLAEAWANGVSWERLIRATNIGEGDIVRLFRRTADMLRQVSRTDGLPTTVTKTALEALRAIDREPIKEISMAEENQMDLDLDKEAGSDLPSNNDELSDLREEKPPANVVSNNVAEAVDSVPAVLLDVHQKTASLPAISNPLITDSVVTDNIAEATDAVPAVVLDVDSQSEANSTTTANEKTDGQATPTTSAPRPTYQHPDWKPLGTVRDYFNEQIQRDDDRR